MTHPNCWSDNLATHWVKAVEIKYHIFLLTSYIICIKERAKELWFNTLDYVFCKVLLTSHPTLLLLHHRNSLRSNLLSLIALLTRLREPYHPIAPLRPNGKHHCDKKSSTCWDRCSRTCSSWACNTPRSAAPKQVWYCNTWPGTAASPRTNCTRPS